MASGRVKLKIALSVLLLSIMALVSGNVYAASVDSEMQGETFIIESLDAKKKIIYLDDLVFSFSSTTIIYTSKGIKTSIDALRPGSIIKIRFSTKSMIRPMLTEIRLVSE